ncbi:MAG: response regulator [Chloroflexota bacterium]
MEIRALVVEDDRSWQQILSEILGDSGLKVDVADSFNAAISLLRTHPHRIALVDLSLSSDDHENRDGLRVLDAIRRHDPGCQAILLTGYATVELAVSAITEYGAFTFLRKENFNRAQFRDLLQRALTSAPVGSETGKVKSLSARTETGTAQRTVRPILVVDDDAGWRSILSELLHDLGHEVRLSSSYGEALGYLRREKYCLAVMDLSLGENWDEEIPAADLEGYQLLKTTRSQEIPTIVVSGIGAPEDIQQAYVEQNIFAFIEKQAFDRATFRELVTEACNATQIPDELAVLTEREREVLDLLAHGLTNKEIAEKLVITTNTVKRHLKAVFEKLNVHTRSAAAAKAINKG